MKKTILYSVLAALCLLTKVSAQDKIIKPIAIGDHLPELILNNVQHYSSPTLKLSSFKGKAIIIDFWATWCTPCVKMIPRMDSLQKKYAGQLQFISVSTQAAATVDLFNRRIEQQQKIKLAVPSVTDDRTLSTLFPHQYLPHYVWINKHGIVTNFSSFDQVNDETIATYLKGTNPEQKEMPEVAEVAYDKSKPLFFDGNGGEPKQIFAHSILSGYVPGLSLGFTVKIDSTNGIKISARNQGIAQLYETAYGYGLRFAGGKNVIYEVSDTTLVTSGSIGERYLNWLSSGNGYCYELHFPAGKVESAYPRMREDLKIYFPQYRAAVEKRKATCMVLKRTSAADKIQSKGGTPTVSFEPIHASVKNAYLNNLIVNLDMMDSNRAVVNETGYKGRVDLEISAGMGDFDAINRELAKYDLHFDKEEREIEFLIIRDAPAVNAAPPAAKGGQQ
ncbi:redoxin domain-containing protein [Mucilaginibacter sp. ZT4R22]|uniref:Redoxin domain-containing protein n=1 Tax=Mucilaginibacter pankratovii TaxID=2772110 RepID=A0ABR7WKZ1_9SPHI|nr:TlpA family protein disulfide reductase [Mucilaginibacter pankratovii]MBD1362975.1 redoxin domain-containing protein [Mucilaginibacter pankratovii]